MLNFFTLLSLPESFAVDLKQLEANYFAAQGEYHPDRAGNSFEALQQGANLNEAYATLRDPFKRACHLLNLHGIDALKEGQTCYYTSELLQESFTMREALTEAGTVEEVVAIEAGCNTRREAVLGVIAEATKQQDWNSLARQVVTLKFLDTFAGEIARAAKRLKVVSHA